TSLSCASVSHGLVFVPDATRRVNSPSPWRRRSASLRTASSSYSRMPGRIAASNSASIASPIPPLIANSATSSGVFTSRAWAMAGEGARGPARQDFQALRIADVGRAMGERDGEIVTLGHRLQPREAAGAELAKIDLAEVGHGELMGPGPRRHRRQHTAP